MYYLVLAAISGFSNSAVHSDKFLRDTVIPESNLRFPRGRITTGEVKSFQLHGELAKPNAISIRTTQFNLESPLIF